MQRLDRYIVEKLRINKDTVNKEQDPDDPTDWQEGDILVTSGGYNMVIIDFYKITKRGNRSFKVKELKQKIVKGNGMQGECIALDEFEKGATELTARITKYNRVKIDGNYASIWSGKPIHFDHMD